MAYAVCFHCGEMKFGALVSCPHCGRCPESDGDLLLPIALPSRHLDCGMMVVIVRDIKEGKRPKLDEKTQQ